MAVGGDGAVGLGGGVGVRGLEVAGGEAVDAELGAGLGALGGGEASLLPGKLRYGCLTLDLGADCLGVGVEGGDVGVFGCDEVDGCDAGGKDEGEGAGWATRGEG